MADHPTLEICKFANDYYTHLWYSRANYKPGFLSHKQKVVAQEDSVFFFISCQEGEELLKEKKERAKDDLWLCMMGVLPPS